MYFQDLHCRLRAYLKVCIQRGEVTERGLARLTGVSQPHIHSVLKGKRLLSPQKADEILRRMHVEVEDLRHRDELPGPREGR